MKKSITFITLSLLLFLFSFAAFSATVFEDNFSTADNFIQQGTATATITAEANKLSISNPIASSAIFKNDKSAIKALQDFTYTVTRIKSDTECNTSGIFFCIQDNGYEGYYFYIQENGIYSLKRLNIEGSSVSFTTLSSGKTSFSTDSLNVLTVSKSGNDISAFVNNEFLTKVSDSQFSQGNIGFIVGANENVKFSSLIVEDGTISGSERINFYDSFDDDLLKGWSIYTGEGTTNEQSSKLTITGAGTQGLRLYTSGTYSAAACTVITSFVSGDSASYYGIEFIGADSTVPNRFFKINAKRQYAVHTSTTGGTQKTNTNIKRDSDTLIITKDHKFIVNSEILDAETFSGSDNFRGVALYVGLGATIEFDEFRIVTDDSNPISHKPINFTSNSPEYEIGGTGIIYDIRGREVAKFEKSNYQNKINQLGAGQFFVISKNKEHMIKRAIINMK